MMVLLQTLVLVLVPLVFLDWTLADPIDDNNFVYHNFNRKNGQDVYFNSNKLYINSTEAVVYAHEGGNATLPCRFWYQPELDSVREVRIKWSWLPATGGTLKKDVLVAVGSKSRSSEEFRGRVRLTQDFTGDASLLILNVQKSDAGRFVCEVVDGLEDRSATVDLELQGMVFPYQHSKGRYFLTFEAAQQACESQNSTVATLSQLLHSWKEGLNWCNAGWLADRSVKYPITQPRGPCGGQDLAPGIRSYARRQQPQQQQHFDVFCFTSSLQGKVYYHQPGHKMTLHEAVLACQLDGAETASVGQMYAAWRFQALDHCAAGWLADGSVRYAITSPRRNCGPSEPGVRSFGFPRPHDKHGVYCYKENPQ
ncbi:hyaluronan and proteoglycan link protein 3-like [Synchiropus splendidus]|uniref:hyaluronan and proteoglycan link protein 3-like n=1 Tax=Synchiropus splendidus TaxID=270530 RepID=UPI00237E04F4|nr:hyaluronan and proteoglycan link protein 3-like [Synchiropus splendidus]